MHKEMGYSYIGPNSFYRLTLDEIQRLQRGYAILNEDKASKPRDSDLAKFAEFRKKLESR